MKVRRWIFCMVCTLCALTLMTACADTTATIERDTFAMNTLITMRVTGEDAEAAIDSAIDDIVKMESLWSVTDEESEIFRLNNGESFSVSDETRELIEFTLSMSEKTDGALDPTIYPIMTAWGFTTSSFQVPSESEIKEKLQLVGYRKITLDGNSISMLPGMQLDFGATAKGFACDKITQSFRAAGITSALVNFGGNIGLIGNREDGSPWSIGVRNPNGGDDIGVLSLSDLSVATSGNYQRYFEDEEGNRYGHIMDPRTGYPIMSDILSVSVIAKESAVCDALSTAVYVMGIEDAVNMWREDKSFDMLLVTTDNRILITDGIEDAFTQNGESFETIVLEG